MHPDERRGLLIQMNDHRRRIAVTDERIERGGHNPRAVQAATRNVWAHGDKLRHAAYVGALRTLCGVVVTRGLRGRTGQSVRPSCETCAVTLDEHLAGGFARPTSLGHAACRGLTRQGTRCKRSPVTDGGYCPSHKHLELAA